MSYIDIAFNEDHMLQLLPDAIDGCLMSWMIMTVKTIHELK